MCGQKGTKSVMDYVKSNCRKVGDGEKVEKGKGKKNKKGRKDSAEMNELCDTLTVTSLKEDFPEIVASESVKEVGNSELNTVLGLIEYFLQVRPFIIFCFITGLDLTGENLKKFLSIQTRYVFKSTELASI